MEKLEEGGERMTAENTWEKRGEEEHRIEDQDTEIRRKHRSEFITHALR